MVLWHKDDVARMTRFEAFLTLNAVMTSLLVVLYTFHSLCNQSSSIVHELYDFVCAICTLDRGPAEPCRALFANLCNEAIRP
jgi:hypothetical protein